MEQEQLWHDTLEEAIRAAISALGGPKKVGPMLWPELSVEDARNRLNNCLNDSRREFLKGNQIQLISREARKVGCHTIAAFQNRDAGYADPVPVEPEDEKAKLQREFVQAVRHLKGVEQRLEKLA